MLANAHASTRNPLKSSRRSLQIGSFQELLQGGNIFLKGSEPRTQLRLYPVLVLSQFLVKIYSVWASFHGDVENAPHDNAVVLSQGSPICGGKGRRQLLVAILNVLPQSLSREVEAPEVGRLVRIACNRVVGEPTNRTSHSSPSAATFFLSASSLVARS